MNIRVYFAIHCVIGLAAIAMLVYAFYQPLASLSINDDDIKLSDDIYITRKCLSTLGLGMSIKNKCSDLDGLFKSQMQAIMGVIIALIACIILELIGFSFRDTISNFFGLLVLRALHCSNCSSCNII